MNRGIPERSYLFGHAQNSPDAWVFCLVDERCVALTQEEHLGVSIPLRSLLLQCTNPNECSVGTSRCNPAEFL